MPQVAQPDMLEAVHSRLDALQSVAGRTTATALLVDLLAYVETQAIITQKSRVRLDRLVNKIHVHTLDVDAHSLKPESER